MIGILKVIENKQEILDCKSEVSIIGYIDSIRDFGKLKFIDVIDSQAKIQVVVKGKEDENFISGNIYEFNGNLKVKKEALNSLKGNKDETGVEIDLISCKLITESKKEQIKNFNEETKLKKRISYLRQLEIKKNFSFQNKFLHYSERFFFEHDFFNLHTPILSFETSEGAKTFRTKSVNYEDFFLSQSPQIYKQSLMCAGFERYFQFSPCFRDENLRSDRQPEFMQLDFEIAYANKDDIFYFVQEYIKYILEKLDIKLQISFSSITYDKAKEKFFSDSPDTRIECSKLDCSELPIELNEYDTQFYVIYKKEKYNLDLLLEEEKENFKVIGNNIYFQNINDEFVKYSFRNLSKCLISDELSFVWVYNMALFEYKDEKLVSCQNPFSKLLPEHENDIYSEEIERLLSIRTISYDLVLNGQEILGGSVRNTSKNTQIEVLRKLGTQMDKMEFFFDLFDDSFPPHAGAALGIERFISILLKKNNIREVIPFPKSNSGKCLFYNKQN